MSVARVYRMQAASGRGDALVAAIQRLAGGIADADGSEGVTFLRDVENPDEVLFIEKWQSAEHHKRALDSMPPGSLDEIQANLAGPPQGSYMDWID